MIDILSTFLIGSIFSFMGSIPPGTINISVMQYSIAQKSRAAFYFILAALLVELIYASLTIKFQIFLSTHTLFTENFQIISALAMLILGTVNLSSRSKIKRFEKEQELIGFKKGFLIAIANPLTIPFWLAVTAYLQNNKMILIHTFSGFSAYVIGIATGTFLLLFLVRSVGYNFYRIAGNSFLVYKVPGIIFIFMGLYNFYSWLILVS